MKAFVSWSGGKETSLACYKVMQNQDVEVTYLLNMISKDGKYCRSHGVSSALLEAQSKATGIPILQRRTSWGTYERVFKKAVLELKKKGINAGVFGDIDLQEHRDWVERICKETKIKAYLPLWGKDQRKIIREFMEVGFEATIVNVKASSLGQEWLGGRIDADFLKRISGSSITPCGEEGEYHSFVTYGPLFKKRIEITKTRRRYKKGRWLLDILEWKII